MKRKNKITIYQVLPRLFGNRKKNPKPYGSLEVNGAGKFSDFTPETLEKINKSGFTHIWYTGIIEHATQTDYSSYGIHRDHKAIVKGKAGSPYAIKDYYDVDPDLADDIPNRMAEFEALIDRTHDAGMKVIIDFVPNHVSRQYHSDAKQPLVQDLGEQDDTTVAFDPMNNYYYLPGQSLVLHFGAKQEDFEYSEFPAKVTGNGCFSANPDRNDWYETVKLNYGIDYMNGGVCYFDPIPDTWHKMLDILLFWVGKGVDGFRCDMVELVPVEFWNWVIPKVKEEYTGLIFIAEAYIPENYKNYIRNGRFDYLYDKVGLYDTLRNVICGKAPAYTITRCWQATEGIQQNMLYFLENHDEQRIASDYFAGSAQAGYPGMIVTALMNTGPTMIYAGQELGERGMEEEGFSGCDGRTTIFDYWRIDTIQRWINDGKFDDKLLSDEEKTLQKSYMQLLNIARQEPVIANGSFFDLMYANNNNPHMNGHRQFAFLRKYEQDVILIAVNFDNTAQTIRIHIPEEAFNTLMIADNQPAILKDLFTGEECISTLTKACSYQVTIPAYSGKVLKFSYQFT
ncbi:MAG: alpha-amylase [Tannerella sp.]|jgi:glycosidase|nr:alpha-amylase [Tannerella sp.]